MTTAVHAPAHLEVRGLGHKFALQTILEAIDLDVTSGEVVALVGPSGCGKTTLLHLCAGLMPVRTGQIISSFNNPACMFQQPRLLPWKSTLDNIALGLKAAGTGRDERTRSCTNARFADWSRPRGSWQVSPSVVRRHAKPRRTRTGAGNHARFAVAR